MTPIIMKNAKHAYDVNVSDAKGIKRQIEVHCANASQAVRLVEKQGYKVRDINMIG